MGGVLQSVLLSDFLNQLGTLQEENKKKTYTCSISQIKSPCIYTRCSAWTAPLIIDKCSILEEIKPSSRMDTQLL